MDLIYYIIHMLIHSILGGPNTDIVKLKKWPSKDAKDAIKNILKPVIRRIINRSWRCMSAYRLGLTSHQQPVKKKGNGIGKFLKGQWRW